MVEEQLEVGREYEMVNSGGRIRARYMGLIDEGKLSFFFIRPDSIDAFKRREYIFLEIIADKESIIINDGTITTKEEQELGYRGVTYEHPFFQDKDKNKIIDNMIEESGLGKAIDDINNEWLKKWENE